MGEAKSYPDLDTTGIKIEDLWVRRWGRFHKVAIRSKGGIDKIKVKKPPRPNLK
ncbi:hypothetical protein A2U01_0111793, partial [Trifolium medium]|nr:hypothetical protein [Trifolium medium]